MAFKENRVKISLFSKRAKLNTTDPENTKFVNFEYGKISVITADSEVDDEISIGRFEKRHYLFGKLNLY